MLRDLRATPGGRIELEGITPTVRSCRTEVPARIVDVLGLEHRASDAADPPMLRWYVKNAGPTVDLFADHSRVVEVEGPRAGRWGAFSLRGRVVAYIRMILPVESTRRGLPPGTRYLPAAGSRPRGGIVRASAIVGLHRGRRDAAPTGVSRSIR